MKKIIIATILAAFSFTSASAEIGVNVGVSGSMGLFVATASEADNGRTATSLKENNQASEFIALGFQSIFIEKSFADRIIIGIDYVPNPLETEEMTETRLNLKPAATATNGLETDTHVQKIKVEFADFTTGYIAVMLTENLYAKVGLSTVDIKTKETLDTGSSYGDTSIEGTSFGVG